MISVNIERSSNMLRRIGRCAIFIIARVLAYSKYTTRGSLPLVVYFISLRSTYVLISC